MSVMPPNEGQKTRKSPPRRGKLTDEVILDHISAKITERIGWSEEPLFGYLRDADIVGKYTSITAQDASEFLEVLTTYLGTGDHLDFEYDLRSMKDALQDEVQINKAELSNERKQLEQLKQQLRSKISPEEKIEITEEIEWKIESIAGIKDDLEDAKQALLNYNHDKTPVLISSINEHLKIKNKMTEEAIKPKSHKGKFAKWFEIIFNVLFWLGVLGVIIGVIQGSST